MAHTVQTLSKLLKKTPDEVIMILANAGVNDKTVDSEISAEERKILMGSLSNVQPTSPAYRFHASLAPNQAQMLLVLKSRLRKSVLKKRRPKRLTLLIMMLRLKHKLR